MNPSTPDRPMQPPAEVHYVVDSIEEGVAALEGESGLLHLPLAQLPAGVREGQVLAVLRVPSGAGHELRIRIDPAATEAALARSRAQLGALPRQNDPGGDIVL